MFRRPEDFLKILSLPRYALRKSLPSEYETICSAKVPKKAVHTCIADWRSYKFIPFVAPMREDHDQKNMRLQRPISPHLTIYAPTLPAMTSIVQRISGTIVTFYALMLSGGALFLPNGIGSCISMIQSLNLSSSQIIFIKVILSLPFCYHYFCGIRFCLFNLGKILDDKLVYSTAYLAIVASGVLAVLFSYFYPHFYEPVCGAKGLLMLKTTMHTSQVDCRQYVFQPYKKPDPEDHDYKNMRLKRPMSPHLTIYAPTLPAMTSIAQRITGTIVAAYAILLSAGALFLSNGIDSYVSMIQSLNFNSFSLILIKIIIGFPFTFHYFCGIRFCFFNIGKLLDKKDAYSSAYNASIASGVLAFLFALR